MFANGLGGSTGIGNPKPFAPPDNVSPAIVAAPGVVAPVTPSVPVTFVPASVAAPATFNAFATATVPRLDCPAFVSTPPTVTSPLVVAGFGVMSAVAAGPVA